MKDVLAIIASPLWVPALALFLAAVFVASWFCDLTRPSDADLWP